MIHLHVLISFQEHSLVGVETAEAAARRIFNSFDPEGELKAGWTHWGLVTP